MFAESARLICSILLMEWIWQYGGNVVPKEISDIPFHSVVVSKKLFFINNHKKKFIRIWRYIVGYLFF